MVSGRLGPGQAVESGIRVRVVPDAGAATAVATVDGDLVLEGARLERSRA